MRQSGLTLIELVVAMSVFSLVAVLGLQALGGTVRLSERAEDMASRHAEVSRGIALLRHDLDAVVPLLFFTPQKGPRSAIEAGPDGFALSLSGQSRAQAPGAAPSGARAVWRLDGDLLVRAAWPTLRPARAAQLGPERAVLGGVERIAVRSYWPDPGWVDGVVPPIGTPVPREAAADGDRRGAAPEGYSGALPVAVEITLTLAGLGPVTLVEALR